MPSRRSHAKTRFGCLPCKRARIKCDENQPQCANCIRLKRRCEYLGQPHARLDGASPSFSRLSASTPSIGPHSPHPQTLHAARSQETSFDDLSLMHTYTLSTCTTLDPRPELLEVWQVVVPREAVTQPYLMHSLLAIAALHQISLGRGQDGSSGGVGTISRDRCLGLAMHHHSLALLKSKAELRDITERNCHALFAFSAMISVSSLALPMARPMGLVDPIGEMAQTAMLMRGSKTIVQSSRSLLEKGRVGPLLRYGLVLKQTALSEDVEVALQEIQRCIDGLDDENERKSCCAALEGLKACFRTMSISQGGGLSVSLEDKGGVFGWLAMVDMDFIVLLFRRQPVALVILAYCAIFMHALDEVWWYRGWGSALINAISETLDQKWESALTWVKHQLLFPRSS